MIINLALFAPDDADDDHDDDASDDDDDGHDDDDDNKLLGYSRLSPCLMSRRQWRGVTKQTNNYPQGSNNHPLIIMMMILALAIWWQYGQYGGNQKEEASENLSPVDSPNS